MSTNNKLIYLYIKTHNKTGLKYFGKTSKTDPYNYAGSGVKWKRHLKKYGYDFSTEIYGQYYNKKDCLAAAIEFSIKNNIVESKEWANLKIESLDGGDTSYTEGYKKSFSKIINKHKKSKWWNNGIKQTFSEFPPDDSFVRGRLSFNNVGAKIGSEVQKGKIWINNGEIEIMADNIIEGYVQGRLNNKKFIRKNSPKGNKWWNNNVTEKMSVSCPGKDWVSGRLKKIL